MRKFISGNKNQLYFNINPQSTVDAFDNTLNIESYFVKLNPRIKLIVVNLKSMHEFSEKLGQDYFEHVLDKENYQWLQNVKNHLKIYQIEDLVSNAQVIPDITINFSNGEFTFNITRPQETHFNFFLEHLDTVIYIRNNLSITPFKNSILKIYFTDTSNSIANTHEIYCKDSVQSVYHSSFLVHATPLNGHKTYVKFDKYYELTDLPDSFYIEFKNENDEILDVDYFYFNLV